MARTHAVVMADPEGIVRHWSPGARTLFGYEPEEAVGRTLDVIVPPEFREKHWAGLRQAAATGQMKLDGATSSVPVLCRDGQVRAFPGRFLFLQGARGDVIGFAALFSERAGGEEPFGPILPLP
jgi:PAS domain S-box-containing protein